jgi:tRNA (guanine37-N1)-methyltransferase
MKIDIITVFPEMFTETMSLGIVGRAAESGLIEPRVHDLRAFSMDKHRRTDDEPFGGGAGMVMTVQPIADALSSIGTDGKRLIYMSPRGRLLDGALAYELSREEGVVILCGRYEGVDQRVLDANNFEEVSIGDYILTGGELPAMVLIDAACRLMPGALGSEDSHDMESVYSGLLEYPQYTRPAVCKINGENMPVPEILTSGHHAKIGLWQYRLSLELTASRRPELFAEYMREFGPNGESGSKLDKDRRAVLSEVASAMGFGSS